MNALFEKREAAGLSQKKLGEMVGITQQAIGHYEAGRRNLSVQLAQKIAKVLGCEWWELYEDNEREVKKGGQK